MYHNLERKSPWTRDCPRNYFILRKKRQGEKQDAIYYGGWVKVPEKDAEHLHRFPVRLFSFSSFLDAPLLSHYSWPSSRPFSYIFNGKWYSAGHLLSSEYIIEKNNIFRQNTIVFHFDFTNNSNRLKKFLTVVVFHFDLTENSSARFARSIRKKRFLLMIQKVGYHLEEKKLLVLMSRAKNDALFLMRHKS